MKVLNIITGLKGGGAEAVLYRLATNDVRNTHIVISLMDEGKYGALLKNCGIDVFCLNMPKGRLTLVGIVKLWRVLREHRSDIVQTWMYHADLLGGVVARLAGIRNVFWNIRHADLEPGDSSMATILIARICARLSDVVPKKIVCCAERAMHVHAELGYSKAKMVVIGNGYQLGEFKPNVNWAENIRREFGLPNVLVLGMVGRFEALKDHENLFKSLALVRQRSVNFKVFLVGENMDANNRRVLAWLETYQLTESVLLLGQRGDIPQIMNALDIHLLSSSSEAFPNVLAEAMACGTPCITTDVGDAAMIVGDTGWVVPPKRPELLAQAIDSALNEWQTNAQAWGKRQQSCRRRITENFSLEKMIDSYHSVWADK